MKKLFFVIVILLIGYFLFSDSTLADENTSMQFSSGIIKSVSDNQIVVSEYDYENDEEVENTYIVDPKTELKGVNSLKEIVPDDNVDIVYTIVDGKNVAQSISIEKPANDDDPPDPPETVGVQKTSG